MEKVAQYFERLRNKKIAFIGLGVAHTDAVKLYLKKGLNVTVLDQNTRETLGERVSEIESLGGQFHLGEDYLKNLTKYDMVFRTPGMRYHTPELIEARAAGVKVTSELEEFFVLCPCKSYGITGSDGKTTTTTVIGETLRAAGKRVFVGGNIGVPLLSIIEEIKEEDYAVVELSSFQLISMDKSPNIAVVTNITPNHLDIHRDMKEYVDAKKNIFRYQRSGDRLVLNAHNEVTKRFVKEAAAEVYWFDRFAPVDKGVFLDGEMISFVDNGEVVPLFPASDIRIPGMHNVENYMAAAAALYGEIPMETLHEVAKAFAGVEHRIEFVRELGGVRYYNDSIATSPPSVMAGLQSFPGREIVLIAGGYDKKIPYEPMAPLILEHVKTLILLGDTAVKICAAVTGADEYAHSGIEIVEVKNMDEAVQAARKAARAGDIVTLSPASASYDMYKNFEERGRHFKDLVNSL